MTGRLLNKSCYRVHNQKANYFLRKDCSACIYPTPAKKSGPKDKKSNNQNREL